MLIAVHLTSSCGAEQPAANHVNYTPRQIAEILVAAQSNVPDLNTLTPEDDYFVEYLSNIHQVNINDNEVVDGVILYAGGVIAYEIAVIQFTQDADMQHVRDAFLEYINRRIAAFSGYAPDQAAVLSGSIVRVHENFAALIIADEARDAELTFLACFSANPPGLPELTDSQRLASPEENNSRADAESSMSTTPPVEPKSREEHKFSEDTDSAEETDSAEDASSTEETDFTEEAGPIAEADSAEDTDSMIETDSIAEPDPTEGADSTEDTDSSQQHKPSEQAPSIETEPSHEDSYDQGSILRAWNTGDISMLTEKNRRVFNMCVEIIRSLITDDMNDFEKQLAIHDWIINWADYDPQALSNAPEDANPDPDNANPYGLLFNRAAICTGFSYTFELLMRLTGFECMTVHGFSFRNEAHAWNLVLIGGEWYVVDVTWNNPIGGGISYRHFNVTSEFLWDVVGHRWDRDSVPEATGLWPPQ